MLFFYLRTFAPWILLAVVSSWSAQAGALAGLAASVLLLGQDLLNHRKLDGLMLEVSTSVFMALYAVLAFAVPSSGLLHYGASMAIGWLALTAWGTVVAGRPFTEGVARRSVSAEIAARPLFRKIVRTIAIAWAVGFTAMAPLLAVVQYLAPHNTVLLIVVKVCGFTIPAVFTARYPEVALKRHLPAAS